MLLFLLLAEVSAVGRIVPLLSAWHYDDLLRDTPPERRPPSVILMYSSEPWCGTLDGWDDMVWPARSHLFLGSYDIASREVWWDEGERLDERFGVDKFPAVVFDAEKTDIWQGGWGTWQEWLWDHLAIDVTIENGLDTELEVLFDDDIATVEEELEMKLLPGTKLAYRRSGDESWILGAEISRQPTCGTMRVVVDALVAPEEQQRDDSEWLNARDQDTTFTHAAMCRQPPKMPKFNGVSPYEVAPLPKDISDRLWAFYRKYPRTKEDYDDTSTGINVHKINTTLISLDNDMAERDAIASLIQPLVEAWAQRPLVFTSFYGIREYHRGHELRMHVDRVATHVFSVIINLHQEDIQDPWPLDVILFDGSRASVYLEPGNILFYQSAKLIHGRPRTLNGSLYVNCFCHFRPNDWPYVYGAGDILFYDGEPLVDYKVD